MDARPDLSDDRGASDDRTAEEIRRDIEARREEIGQTVVRIQENVRTRLDWRLQVGRRPGIAFAGAALLGLWAGLAAGRRAGRVVRVVRRP